MGFSFLSAKCTSTARLDGKIVVITGCNTGIGLVTTREIFKRGAKVIMACRNLEKAAAALEEIKKETVGEQNLGTIQIMPLDLSSLKSVRACAHTLLQDEPCVDILINNAGVMMCPQMRTEDGFDMQFGTNHLGHFLFTLLLMPTIMKSEAARVINVASHMHYFGRINFDDLNYEKRRYGAIGAYSQSKLANILFTKELSKRLKEANITNVTTYSLHPGMIRTELVRHLDDAFFSGLQRFYSIFYAFIKTPNQGAQTTLHCAISEKAAEQTGLYYSECGPTWTMFQAKNMDTAARLWEESLKLVALPDSYDPFKSKV